MRLIPYIRVSTEEQAAKGHSLGHQIDRLNLWATVAGHELVGVIIDDGVSGSIPLARRKGGAELIDKLRSGAVDGVAVIRLDRLFRNALDGLRFFEEELQSIGASVHSLAESIDTSTPSGWLMLIMLLAQADYARRLDVQRGRETNKALRESGKVYGNVPFGCVAVGGQKYLDDGKVDVAGVKVRTLRTRGAKLFRDPAKWAIREFIVDRRVHAVQSFAAIAADLRARGIRSPEGSRTWSKSTLANICETHADLCHLPLLSEESGAALCTSTETGVSHATH